MFGTDHVTVLKDRTMVDSEVLIRYITEELKEYEEKILGAEEKMLVIEQRIYERQALLCRYRYLLARARELGLHTVLTKYQPAGQL